ncbi:hypothetical protein ASE12_11065 [Aeromicrobium sp. Root236]|uniref:SRPBCC family protein n=1 Tax=Aeromicrobium sp. Root236 TaxID=1736498 RepID=UPI000700B8B9|nr:SRPBCC domain-containing protein [Aeromicrobium sp. Root236]KRC65254.1 hypothetical protein ASE12_11065 [Aeromicrobium sp. Root236]
MTETTYEVNISRYFDAPPELVYRAFSDPEQLAQWFGPLMFVVPIDTVDIDVRSGGHWKMTMVGKDNPEWRAPINASFTEVVENQLIVGYETAESIPGIEDGTQMSLSIEFIPEGDGTRLQLRQGPFPEQMHEMSELGWNQSFYKLDALLATPAQYRNTPTEADAS